MRARATEVRELESAASVRISPSGHLETSRMLRTGPRQAIPTPGTVCQVLPQQFEAGEDADVHLARRQQVGALGGHAEQQVEEALLVAVEHAPDQGNGIEIANGADFQRVVGHGSNVSVADGRRNGFARPKVGCYAQDERFRVRMPPKAHENDAL